MSKYFLASWCSNLTDPNNEFNPIGIIARENDSVEIRIKTDLPDYEKSDLMTRHIFDNLADILKETRQYSQHPTNLYITEIKPDLSGSLAERADQLFEKYVLKRG